MTTGYVAEENDEFAHVLTGDHLNINSLKSLKSRLYSVYLVTRSVVDVDFVNHNKGVIKLGDQLMNVINRSQVLLFQKI